MKLKTIVALSLTAAMALSLAACGEEAKSTSTASTSTKTESTKAESTKAESTKAESTKAESTKTESTTASSSTASSSVEIPQAVFPDGYSNDDLEGDEKIGTIYDDFDYNSRDTYHVVQMTAGDDLLEHQMFDCYKSLQDKYNFTIEYATANRDDEAFITTLNTLIDRGDVDGFIIEANSYQSDALLPILRESGIPWVNEFTEFYNEDGTLACPTVIIPQWQSGYDSVSFMCEHFPEWWGTTPDWSDIGLISVDFSVSQPLADRTIGIKQAFLDAGGSEDHVFIEDSYAMGESMWMTLEAGYEPVTTIVASNPDIHYWIFSSCLEYYAQGAARAAEDLGIDDKMCISCVGSSLYYDEHDNGYDGAWHSTIAINNYAYATPLILGVMAIIDGRVTQETLWPDKHNYFSDTDKYGVWRADYTNVTKDNYHQYWDAIEKKYGP